MIDFLLRPAVAPFSVALLLMLLLGAVQAIGLGADAELDADTDSPGALGAALDWLNIGRLPLLMLLSVFLTGFGLVGILLQQAVIALIGGALPWFAAVPAALAIAVPVTRWLGQGLARVIPRDETTAIDLNALLGRRGRIVIGTARPGSPARARVDDAFGQPHFVMVEPTGDGPLTADAELLLTARHGDVFRVIEIQPDIFSQLRPTP